MGCEPGQTSAILDCICVNGQTLIEYIDGGDQTLQGLITALQQTITALQACCSSNSAAIAVLQAAVALLQAQAHAPVTLTKTQDLVNRAALFGQVLNLPPAIAGRIGAPGLSQMLTAGPIYQVVGLNQDFDTWTGMPDGTPVDSIIIPRAGRYNLSASWGTSTGADPCAQAVIGASIGINGFWMGRFTNPIISHLAEGAHARLPFHPLALGDVITVGAFTDCAGMVISSAYLAVEYVEGT